MNIKIDLVFWFNCKSKKTIHRPRLKLYRFRIASQNSNGDEASQNMNGEESKATPASVAMATPPNATTSPTTTAAPGINK